MSVARDDPGVYYCRWGLQALHSSRQTGALLVVSSLINHSHEEGKEGLGMFYHGWKWKCAQIPELWCDQGWKSHWSLSLSASEDRSAASQTFGRQLSLQRPERQVGCSLAPPLWGSGENWLLISQKPRWAVISARRAFVRTSGPWRHHRKLHHAGRNPSCPELCEIWRGIFSRAASIVMKPHQ